MLCFELPFHITMAIFSIYIFMTLCLSTSVFGFRLANARHQVQAKGRETCTTKAGTSGECVSLLECLTKPRKFQDWPNVCRWEFVNPVLCCPIAEVEQKSGGKDRMTNALTCGDPYMGEKVYQLLVKGGEDATIGEWPWMALIFLEEDTERKTPICGGSLITQQSILTAAHCFIGRSTSKLIVRLGEHNLAESGELGAEYRTVEIKVNKIVTHKDFRFPSLYNDVAVLHLESKAELTYLIRLVCLPKGHETFVNKKAVVTGWGNLEYGGKGANTLQELELPVISNDECQKKYDSLHASKTTLPNGITNSMICAGIENGKDACQGDSGGPLVLKNKGKWSQIGIVSAGYQCGVGFPGLYTRVTAHLEWIAKNTI